ncbi:ABC transporter permease [Marinisporobacter balticus]|uniref:Putative ABC transport system permease protein n=1 Tax=Marinisporobacter balticus TaxID=2018667 RepID=A0A4R2KXV5_9FIRM|nr:ABC transporter permease [Marinisporobacter balticus]TCO77912.1 putative ABC transport system permease protein [Marinisporobacter balticus]
MRFANNNKAIINKLTRKSIQSNKLRNLFAIVAISLTTLLFTSLFTIGMGMIESMEQQTMRQVGGYAHGGFKYLTKEDFNKIKDHPLIKEYGYSIMLNMAENKEFLKHHTEIRYATDQQAKMFFSDPTTGKMPQNENEIATDTKVLDLLGIPHKIGEKLTIEYTIGKEKFSKKFVLSGFCGHDKSSPASMIFVSHKFIDKNLTDVTIDPANQKYIGTGLIFLDIMFENSKNIEKNLEKILIDCGYSSDENAQNYIPIGVNWAYLSTNFDMDLPTIISVSSAILLIIFTGYLIIYNIFQISVMKDIHFYGLLKTIGTTPKQIKKLVKKQALLLSIIGIPLGLVIGYLLGNVLLPIIMHTSTIETTYISSSPIIFIGATIFSVITVFISCRKPGKMASKVSSVEATRYVDVTTIHKKKKQSLKGGKIHNMAFCNLLRSKKKTIVVVISMSLSIILLNSVFTLTKGFDMDKFLSTFVITDFTAGNANYFNMNQFRSEDDIPSEKMIQHIDALDGIENKGRIYYNTKYTFVTEKITGIQLYGLEDFPLSQLNIFEGEIDLEKFKTGNYIIEGVYSDNNRNIKYETSKYNIGDKVNISFENNTTKEYVVMAKAELIHNMSVRYYIGGACTLYLPSNEFIKQIKDPLIMSYVFNVKDTYINKTEKFLKDYTNNIEPQMDYESKQKYVDDFKNFQNMFLLVGGVLSFIIGFIGVLNFINAILTSIISRRREFAMLQSIGMTNKQLNKMLIFEGVFYALTTLILSIFFGSIVSFTIVQPMASSIWFYKYKFIISPILIVSPILILISIFVPLCANMSINKQTIVERLREIE